ncbi:MAG: YigZ family protein [Clostridia bacterium]|nr:YigZ family protein [Clostridia bacterium]
MTLNEITTIKSDVKIQIEMKKSVFIAIMKNVASEEEAKQFLEDVKKEYKDATHHVPAYRIYDDSKSQIIERCSDDGEPSGTSGKPILDILKHKDLLNVEIIVVRYFGGTLLGTGGLVKAYSDACKEALNNSEIVTLKKFKRLEIKTDYESFNKIKKEFEDANFLVSSPVYALDVNFDLHIELTDSNLKILEGIFDKYKSNIIAQECEVCFK